MFPLLALAAVAFGVWAFIRSGTSSSWDVTITVTPAVPEGGREAFVQTMQASLPSTSKLESVSYKPDKTVVRIKSTDSVRPYEGAAMLGSYSLRSEVSP